MNVGNPLSPYRPAPYPGASGDTQANSQNATGKEQRRAVKKIATGLESDLKKYDRIHLLTRDVAALAVLRDKITAKQEHLAVLQTRSLDRTAPRPTTLRQVKSGAVLASAMASRVGAIATATTVGAVEGGVVALALPVLSAINGATSGFEAGWKASVLCAKPATAVVGMGLGTAGGAVGGVLGALVFAPLAVGVKGSCTRKTFSHLDQYARADAHAARKKMSTYEIAEATRRALARTLEKVDNKHDDAQFIAAAPAMLRGMLQRLTNIDAGANAQATQRSNRSAFD